MKKVKIIALLFLVCLLGLSACSGTGDAKKDEESAGGNTASENGGKEMAKPVVEITMEDGGVIKLELDRSAAPKTVENFLKLANDGFYDGLTFHRVINGFMIQGGDPLGIGTGGSDEEIFGEFSSNGHKDNTIDHKRGVISMARSGNPNSASSQFFIVHQDAPHLNGQYAAFGEVIEGMDAVDKIASVQTGANDKPVSPVVIKTVKVISE